MRKKKIKREKKIKRGWGREVMAKRINKDVMCVNGLKENQMCWIVRMVNEEGIEG